MITIFWGKYNATGSFVVKQKNILLMSHGLFDSVRRTDNVPLLLRRLLRDDTKVVVQVVQGRGFTARDGIGRIGARERFLQNGRRKNGCNRLVVLRLG